MFRFVFVLVFSLGFSSFAYCKEKSSFKRKVASQEVQCAEGTEGGIDPDFIVKKVEATDSCSAASHIVESCAAGSTMDGITTSAAIQVCEKYTGKLNKADQRLKKMMSARCEKVCNRRTDGTLCVATISFCLLDVAKFMNSINQKE